jgi:hypothetical protein
MDVNRWLLRHYVDYVAAGWFDPEAFPPDDVREYGKHVEELRKAALAHHEMDALRLGLDYVLAHPDLDVSDIGRTRYPYSDDEVREIMKFIRKTIWPDTPVLSAEELGGIRLIKTTLAEWKATR